MVLHGLENHRPPQHWQFLLAAQLVERGHDVRYPSLPDPDSPTLSAWQRVLRHELSVGDCASLTVVCHSLACLLWMHAADDLPEPVSRLLLVSPPDSAMLPETAASFRLSELSPGSVRASARQLTIVASDDDPYNPPGAQALYGDPLAQSVRSEPGGGHLTPTEGYGAWPWVLQWCLETESGDRWG